MEKSAFLKSKTCVLEIISYGGSHYRRIFGDVTGCILPHKQKENNIYLQNNLTKKASHTCLSARIPVLNVEYLQ